MNSETKKMTLPHLAMYAVAVLVWIASLDKTQVTATFGPTVGTWAAPVITAAGVILTFLHQYGYIKSSIPVADTSKVIQSAAMKVMLPLLLVLPFLHGCANQPKLVSLPPLTTAQLQTMTKQVCVALTTDLTLLEGPTGKALLPPATMTQVTTTIGPTITAVCSSGAAIDVTSLQTLNSTVLPALIAVVAAVPAIPDQEAILAGLTLAQVALVPIVNDALSAAAAQAAASSAPSSAPAPVVAPGHAPPTTDLDPIPPQNRNFALIESPQAVGGATAAVTVAALQAFWHYSTSAPTAAALVVLATLGAAYLDL
jgi:hypothetical protein